MLILGAAIGATMLGALPASAEVVVRGPGAAVVVGEHHDDWRYRHHRSWRRDHAECRVVRVRTTLPNGNVIIKTRRSC
jgi:hypothetical protein